MKVERTFTPVDTDIVSLSDIKDHLRVTGNSEDDLITALISVARSMIEEDTGLHLCDGSYKIYFDAPMEQIDFPMYPVTAVTAVKYFDENNSEQTWGDTNYLTDLKGKFTNIFFEELPDTYDRPSNFWIECTGGTPESDVSDKHPEVIQAIKMICSHLYEFRGDSRMKVSSLRDADNKMTNFPFALAVRSLLKVKSIKSPAF